MGDNVLMPDTSQMQTLGHSQVDFTYKNTSLVLIPRAKASQIFGLSLPASITGGFNDFGILSGALIVTTIRFVTSPVVAPLSGLMKPPLETDGSALCQQLYN